MGKRDALIHFRGTSERLEISWHQVYSMSIQSERRAYYDAQRGSRHIYRRVGDRYQPCLDEYNAIG